MEDCGCKCIAQPDRITINHADVVHCPLHAAAPELLEACKEFVKTLESWATFAGEFETLPARLKAMEAIAHAESKE